MQHEDIRKLAALARLELTDEEVSQQGTDMDAILGYIEQLRGVDVTDLAPTSQVTGLMNVLREDTTISPPHGSSVEGQTTPEESREELLANSPDQHNGYIRVPGVFTLRSDGATGDEFPEEGVL